jgi:carbamoyl-phosphate synthase small subunit
VPVGTTFGTPVTPAKKFKVAAFDYGAKRFHLPQARAARLRRAGVPGRRHGRRSRAQARRVFLSNGPGDPAALPYIHKTVTALIPNYPIFGICLGHQMITHALGGTTFKLKFGHRGGNQPVKNLETGKVSITAQNHGFATDPKSIEQPRRRRHRVNLNDNTVEGLRHKALPVFSVQYHPEAAPGPNDADPLFVDFYRHGRARKAGKSRPRITGTTTSRATSRTPCA